MNRKKHVFKSHTIVNEEEFKHVQNCLQDLKIFDQDTTSVAMILIKRRSATEESVLKGILRELGLPQSEILAIISTYSNKRSNKI